ncbi:serine/threonine-protein kinase [Nocardioides sp. YIM 152588]|uniref:serine/threonine-protein kinase n=1 Tax=Nocardioides sp. YIM 152588 TaxID=3158259 RepID=UPI0032E4AD8D
MPRMTTTRTVDGRYRLEREIGRGGSGPVWLGTDELLGREVALKRLGAAPGAEDVEGLRAEREARMTARVQHPRVVTVFDLVETQDDHWLVMEHVSGGTLSQRIRERGGLSADEAAPLLADIAEALAAAHEVGVVHRDIKPSNILIDADGAAKLSDFGIAKGVTDASLTRTGLVTGSPAYLSPEVAAGGSAVAASDVWAFGATLFHVLAGVPPYEVTDSLMGALYKIVNEEPPRLDDAGWLAPLLRSTMSRDAEARPTMAQVAEFLRAGAAHAVAPAAPATTPAGPARSAVPHPADLPTMAAAPAPGQHRRERRLVPWPTRWRSEPATT